MMRPSVTVSYAQSADGRIAARDGSSQWISGEETLRLAHELRRDHDAVLVGVGTVLADNPQLTCRLPGCRSPLRVVMDTRLRTPEHAHVVADAKHYPTVVIGGPEAETGRAETLRAHGVTVIQVAASPSGALSLGEALTALASRGCRRLLVEGGSAIITTFFAERLVDELVLVSAPLMIGHGVSAVAEMGTRTLGEALRGTTVDLKQLGQDVVWRIRFGGG